MRIASKLSIVLVVLALSLGGGVASASCTPTSNPCPAGDPISSEAPTVDPPGADAIPSVLGTVFRLQWAGERRGVQQSLEFLVQPTSVQTVDAAADTRLVQVVVKFQALLGPVVIDPDDFYMVDTNQVKYGATTAPENSTVAPMVHSTLGPGDGVAACAVYIQVPLRSAGLVIAYDPSPSDVSVGSWTLSAP